MQHVCLLTDSDDPSGVWAHMLTLARELRGRWQVTLAIPENGTSTRLTRQAAAHDLDARPYATEALEDWLADSDVAVFHVHAGVAWEGHHAVAAGRRAGVRAVVRTEHLPQLITTHDQRGAHRALLRQLDRVICVSRGVAQSYVASGIPADWLTVVRNGTRTIEAPPDRLGTPTDVALVLAVGRLVEQKRFDVLIEAAAELPRARVLIVGEGPLEDELRALISDRDVRDRVTLCGRRNDVESLLAGADVLAIPSQFEGLPLVALEAMSVGTPVVGTRVCGLDEVVVDGVTGRLVPAGDPGALALALAEAIATPDLRRAWGEEGARRHRARFGAERMGEEVHAVYEEALRGPSARPPRRGLAMKTRIGFVGGGAVANRHLANLLEIADVEIAAIADPAEARAHAFASRCGATAYAHHDDMLARERLDALYICVPPFAHGAPELAAVDADLPFFVEKPLAVDLETAETVAQALEGRELVTGAGYHWRYLDTYERARDLLAENPARLAIGYWLDATPPPSWWVHREQSGGQMVEQTTHVLDLARTLVGEVTSVYAAGAESRRPEGDVDDASTATLQFETGAIGSISSTSLLNWPHRIGLHTFSPSLVIELSEFEMLVDIGQGRPVTPSQVDPFVLEDRDFVDAVQGKPSRVRVPYGEALRTHRLACAVDRSALEGRPLELAAVAARA